MYSMVHVASQHRDIYNRENTSLSWMRFFNATHEVFFNVYCVHGHHGKETMRILIFNEKSNMMNILIMCGMYAEYFGILLYKTYLLLLERFVCFPSMENYRKMFCRMYII